MIDDDASHQLEGGLECSVDVKILFSEKAKSLPQLRLPGEEVEAAAHP